MNEREFLFQKAKAAANFAYAPYSRFRVAAALLCDDSSIITGVNVENRSYGLTNCAERSAIFSGVSQGKTGFMALLIYCPDSDKPIPPCGACRQVITEFMEDGGRIYFTNNGTDYVESRVKDLLPHDTPGDLKRLRKKQEQ